MKTSEYSVSFDEFSKLAQHGNLIPVYREILADLETPVSAFLKLNKSPTAFLFESIEGGETWARYSFLGTQAHIILWEEHGSILIQHGQRQTRLDMAANPLEHLRALLAPYRPVSVPGLPRFTGGAVGYLGYDVVRHFETIPERPKEAAPFPTLAFLLTDTLVIFDNVAHTIKVVANAHVPSPRKADVQQAYAQALDRIEALISQLKHPLRQPKLSSPTPSAIRFTSNLTQSEFEKIVLRAKEYIQAGDIIQSVLSQRWRTTITVDPFEIYRALRVLNPSPYMFYLRIAGTELVGASPEVLVRCEEGTITVRPIAGTRPRGKTESEDLALAEELLADPKERAEHVMLVDLGRNDIGRVAQTGTVTVHPFMTIERYSHVMHIVSQVTGHLDPSQTVFDVMKACFPAGTVTGAPKVRAMHIIEELEPTRRGPYAGAVGYFSFSGNMDTCINIRTVCIKDREAYIQAGAGIVADSDPAREYEETCNKARAMMRSIELAEQGLE